MDRIRITYAKTDAMRYTSNLDVHKIWERILRRANLPLAYSQGFHPQPRINQACPLPLGIISWNEMIDIWLDENQLSLADIQSALIKAAPSGIKVLHLEQIVLSEPSLPTQIVSTEYRARLLDPFPADQLRESIQNVLESAELQRKRRDKTYDLRPLIEALDLEPPSDNNPPVVTMRLAAREGATGRPDEVLNALGIDPLFTRIERTRMILLNQS